MRSNLSLKFNIGTVNKYLKSLREKDKDLKKKNLSRYITVDVVNRKGIPDLDDTITLVRLGNNDCDDEQAYDILQRWLEDENNKKRGIAGAFCDLCNDFSLDIPVDSMFKEHCSKLEDYIVHKLEVQNKINSLIDSITNMTDKLEEQNNKEQENKEQETEDSKEFEDVENV